MQNSKYNVYKYKRQDEKWLSKRVELLTNVHTCRINENTWFVIHICVLTIIYNIMYGIRLTTKKRFTLRLQCYNLQEQLMFISNYNTITKLYYLRSRGAVNIISSHVDLYINTSYKIMKTIEYNWKWMIFTLGYLFKNIFIIFIYEYYIINY